MAFFLFEAGRLAYPNNGMAQKLMPNIRIHAALVDLYANPVSSISPGNPPRRLAREMNFSMGFNGETMALAGWLAGWL